MTFNEFYEWFQSTSKPDELRRGQYAFCCLRNQKIELARRIIATKADPFYDDSRLEEFWKTLKEIWV